MTPTRTPEQSPIAPIESPRAARTQVLVRAGTDPVRLLRTLSGVLREPRCDFEVTVVAHAENPLEARFAKQVRFVRSGRAPLLELVRCGPNDALLLLEEGCLLPPHWSERLAAHAAELPNVDVISASTNHARGPSRLDTETLPDAHRISPSTWAGAAASVAERWPGVAENVESVSSPLLYLTRPGPRSRRLDAWWSAGLRTPLVLRSDARIALARDLVVWREPRRQGEEPFLGAEVYDVELALTDLEAPSARLHAWAEALFEGATPRPRAHGVLAQLLCRRGEFREALRHARACLAVWPHHVDVRLWEAVALLRSGDLARAQGRLTELQQTYPLDRARKAHLFACSGEIWRIQGDGNQAQQGLRTALDLEPREPLALCSLGYLRLEAGQFEEALSSFQSAVRADPEHACAWSGFGRALALSGEVDEARHALGRALALQPGDREARRLLSRIVPANSAHERMGPTLTRPPGGFAPEPGTSSSRAALRGA